MDAEGVKGVLVAVFRGLIVFFEIVFDVFREEEFVDNIDAAIARVNVARVQSLFHVSFRGLFAFGVDIGAI